MPHYHWTGIDTCGTPKKGILAAHTPTQLQATLLQQGIALLSCKEKRKTFVSTSFFKKRLSITPVHLISFFHHLSLLLSSGIPLINALELTQNHATSRSYKHVLHVIIAEIKRGASLSFAMQQFPACFSTLMIQLTKSGEKSGALAQALENLSSYLQERHTLLKNLKNAALLPFLTILLACFIVGLIFVAIIPQFEPLFSSLQKDLPSSTQFLLSISAFLQNEFNQFHLLASFLGGIIALKILGKRKRIIYWKSKILLSLPFIRRIIILSNTIQFLQTLSLLVQSGNPLTQSLVFAGNTCSNVIIRDQAYYLAKMVDQGYSLENALHFLPFSHFPSSLRTAIAIGEQTGNLETMLEKSAHLFQEELASTIHVVSTVFQPLLLVGTGLFIAFLMLALYVPIFNMSHPHFP